MFKKIIVAAALSTVAGVAVAEDQNGLYFGMGAGEHSLEFDGIEGDDLAVKVFSGYRFNRYLAAEATYIEGGSPSFSYLGENFKLDTEALQASVIGSIPVNELFSFYARAGVLAWEVSESSEGRELGETDGTDFSYGLGAELKFERASLRLEYEGAELDEGTDLQLITLSVLGRF